MKNALILALAAAALLATAGCGLTQRWANEPYENPFWARYLVEGDPLDDEILITLEALRADDSSPVLHNRLGRLLLEKGFPKDAEWEFRRALEIDPGFYPSSYNIALSRQARDDRAGARRALRRTLRAKPGHAAAHFQLGLMMEEDGDIEGAVHHYAKAYAINRALLDPRVNPRIVDTNLTDLAMLELYEMEHIATSIRTEPSPESYPVEGRVLPDGEIEAPSDVEEPEEIVTPAPGPTEEIPSGDQ